MSRLLIDTNILVYSKDISSAFHRASIKLFKGTDHLFTTSKNLAEYYAVVTKGEKPFLTATEALNDLTEFASYCEVL
jgi:predicted nucleic acid-binding protein